jgi:hypothetical protein
MSNVQSRRGNEVSTGSGSDLVFLIYRYARITLIRIQGDEIADQEGGLPPLLEYAQ